MKLSVTPTRIEIVDEEMKCLVAVVETNDEVTVKVDMLPALGWNDWLDITDAVRKAMHMMGMGEK